MPSTLWTTRATTFRGCQASKFSGYVPTGNIDQVVHADVKQTWKMHVICHVFRRVVARPRTCHKLTAIVPTRWRLLSSLPTPALCPLWTEREILLCEKAVFLQPNVGMSYRDRFALLQGWLGGAASMGHGRVDRLERLLKRVSRLQSPVVERVSMIEQLFLGYTELCHTCVAAALYSDLLSA